MPSNTNVIKLNFIISSSLPFLTEINNQIFIVSLEVISCRCHIGEVMMDGHESAMASDKMCSCKYCSLS